MLIFFQKAAQILMHELITAKLHNILQVQINLNKYF